MCIHSPDARVGRIQNYGSWPPNLINEGYTCLGLEYSVSEGDDLWGLNDGALIELAKKELHPLHLVPADAVGDGYVVRVPKAYPVYDAQYAKALDTIRDYLAHEWPQDNPVGRNGMHRYNNQDHSTLTAMLTADNSPKGQSHDIRSVNVDDEYHEEGAQLCINAGPGRQAPVFAQSNSRVNSALPHS